MSTKKSIGIWIRVSTEDQAKGDSPEHHEERAKAYAKMKEWNVYTVYHLEGISGKTIKNHPETQRMLTDLKEGKITGLIFSKLARFARNTRELLEFADIFRDHKADLISLQESIDTSTPAGRLFFTFTAAMTQWEREEIADRIAASIPIRAKLGKSLGGAAPYGYKWVDKKLEIDEEEAPVRKLMYQLFIKHKKKKTVADLLTKKGYRTRKGRPFSDTTVRRLLEDPISKGVRRVNYTKSLGENKKWVLKPESEWVLLKVPAIVTEKVWDEVNSILKQQLKVNKRETKKVAHIFTGYVVCHCGNKMYVLSNSPKYTCHNCRNKIREDDLEEIFHDQLKDFLFNEEEISKHLENSIDGLNDKRRQLEVLISKSKKLKLKLDSIMELYEDGNIPKEAFSAHYTPIFEQYQQVLSQIPTLQGEIKAVEIDLKSSDQIIHDARNLHGQWKKLYFEEKRAIVKNILEKIEIGNKEVSINLCYFPVFNSETANSQHNHMDS